MESLTPEEVKLIRAYRDGSENDRRDILMLAECAARVQKILEEKYGRAEHAAREE